MNPISVHYRVTIAELHTATYFGLFTRYRLVLRIFFVVAISAAICTAGSWLGLFPSFLLPAYLFLGYFIWLVFVLANTERGVLKLAKQEESLLKQPLSLTFQKDTMQVKNHKNEQSTIRLQELCLVFELSDLFLIYLDAQNVILLPTRTLTGEERLLLREKFLDHLHDRFQTRYRREKAPKLRSLTGNGRQNRFF